MTILVVDDEKDQLKSLNLGLRRKGYRVLEASNAEDALRLLDNGRNGIDMVLTDYAMPGTNGMELLKKVREEHGLLPVIMMTAHGEKGLVIDALRNRCDSFIEKPFILERLLQEIERAKIEFLKNFGSDRLTKHPSELVHQINNPLTAILANAELTLLELNDQKAVKEHMTNIKDGINKIKEINKTILKSDRKAHDKTEMVNMKRLLDECLKMFEELAALKGVVVEKDLGGRHLMVAGSRFGLEQLFNNLILNAIEAMDGRLGKRLKLRAKMDRDDFSVSVYIEDTGCGIPKEAMDKIFTSYFTSKKNGTGLGLSVVKGMVENHNGKIEVQSIEGEGTTFKVTLPASQFNFFG